MCKLIYKICTKKPTSFYIIGAWINTFSGGALTLLIKGTIFKAIALCLTADQGITLEPLRA